MLTAPSSHQTPSQQGSILRYHLPRFNLHFELHPGSSKLYSYDYSGYYVADERSLQQSLSVVGPEMQRLASLPLPLLLDQFIILVADNSNAPVRVLIPDALTQPGSRGPASFKVSSQVEIQVEHHVYRFHPHTGCLEATGVLSRLHLAALHSACSSAVPLTGLGMTGGEHALQLLRESWVNRPLTLAESRKLSALAKLSFHTPALQLACERLHTSTVSLRFLYDNPSSVGSHDEWVKCNVPEIQNVEKMYNQELQRPSSRFPVVCSRRLVPEQSQSSDHHRRWKRSGQSFRPS